MKAALAPVGGPIIARNLRGSTSFVAFSAVTTLERPERLLQERNAMTLWEICMVAVVFFYSLKPR